MDEYRVETPENIAFSYDISGIGSRFLAALVDTAILALLLSIALLTVTLLLSTETGRGLMSQFTQSVIVAGFVLLTFSIYWSYYILFELIWNGQSPGKRLAGLRVIRTDGTPVTVVDSIVRNIVRLVDFMPTFYGVGIMVMLINSQSRRLGDLAAGTVVVKERREVTLAHLTQSAKQAVAPAPAFLPAEAAQWPVERLTEDDDYIINEFFARRDKIVTADDLARKLAMALRAKLDLSSPQSFSGAEAVQFLAQVAAVYRSRASTSVASAQFVCPQCGASVNEGAPRCPICGTRFKSGLVCPQCGSAMNEGAIHCLVCGARFELRCPHCGRAVSQHYTRCPNCGTEFDQNTRPAREAISLSTRQAQPIPQPAIGAGGVGAVLICPHCHTVVSQDADVCPNCGQAISKRN